MYVVTMPQNTTTQNAKIRLLKMPLFKIPYQNATTYIDCKNAHFHLSIKKCANKRHRNFEI